MTYKVRFVWPIGNFFFISRNLIPLLWFVVVADYGLVADLFKVGGSLRFRRRDISDLQISVRARLRVRVFGTEHAL